MKTLDDIKKVYERPCEHCEFRLFCMAGFTREKEMCAYDMMSIAKDMILRGDM